MTSAKLLFLSGNAENGRVVLLVRLPWAQEFYIGKMVATGVGHLLGQSY